MTKPKKEKGWLMATGLMGIDKTLRTLRWSGLTLPQFEFLSRRLAMVRAFHHAYNDRIKGTKYTVVDYNNPKSGTFIITNSTLSQLATPDNYYPPDSVWLRGVLNWIPDKARMTVFPWAAPFLKETRTWKQWEALSLDFMIKLNKTFRAERSAKRYKGGKSRKDSKAWVMDAKKYEILIGDPSNDYRWKKRKEMRAMSQCLHAASEVCQGKLKALPKFSAETLKYVGKNDLRKLREIIKCSQRTEAAQWKKHKEEARELRHKLFEIEKQVEEARTKLARAERILAARK